MVHVIALLAAAATAAPAAPRHTMRPRPQSSAAPVSRDAPIDEYFGSQKMSAIGIRMRIDALGRRFHERSISDGDVLHDAQLTEQSLHAWAEKYPSDRWIAPTAYHLAQLYMDVQTTAARALAKSAFAYVTTAAPKTREASASRARLHAGFPPLHEEPPLQATPTPAPLQTVAPAGAPASAAPSAAPAASAAPATASPVAAPSTTPAPAATLRGVLERPKS